MVVSLILDTNNELCQAQKAENTDPRTNYAVKYATARGHLRLQRNFLELFLPSKHSKIQ